MKSVTSGWHSLVRAEQEQLEHHPGRWRSELFSGLVMIVLGTILFRESYAWIVFGGLMGATVLIRLAIWLIFRNRLARER
jgi:hypothetical protein